MAAADFDRDGVPDAAVGLGTDAAAGVVRIHLGRGIGGARENGVSFSRSVTELDLPAPPDFLAAGWLDVPDGLDDLAVAVAVDSPAGAQVAVFRSLPPASPSPPAPRSGR